MKVIYAFAIAACCFLSCSSPDTSSQKKLPEFIGQTEAIEKANSMFEAIGGKEAWGDLRSLYIKAIHEEPDLEMPYESQIWRDLKDFKIRIEQRSEEFHRIGLFSDEGAWVVYADSDSLRQISEEGLESWRFDHQHNVYYLLRKMALEDSIEVKVGVDDRLEFYQEDAFLCAFGLDEKNRPYHFYQPQPQDGESHSVFSRWGTTNELVHSAGGGPIDSSFSYITQVWEPSNLELLEAFPVRVAIPEFDFSELNWLLGTWGKEYEGRGRYETWNKINETRYEGLGFALNEKDTVFQENIVLEKTPEGIFYIPAVSDQNDGQPIPFKFQNAFESRYVFTNPNHDFPKKIVYEKAENDTLKARVSGGDKTIEFVFTKVVHE